MPPIPGPSPAGPKRVLAIVLGFALLGGVVGGVLLVRSRGDSGKKVGQVRIPEGWSSHTLTTEGFAIGLPPGWRALPAGEVDSALEAIRADNAELAELVESQIAGSLSSLVRFFALDVDSPTLAEDFATNANVVVEPLPEGLTFEQYVEANLTQLRKVPGVTISEENPSVDLPSGRAARIRSTFTLNSPSGPRQIAVTQFLVLKENRGFILSLTTTPSHEPTYRSVFEEIAKTFQPL